MDIMKIKLLLASAGLLMLSVAPVSNAQVAFSVGVGVNTCGYPGAYYSCPVYAPPVAVYLGGGGWGGRDDHRGGRGGHGGRRR